MSKLNLLLFSGVLFLFACASEQNKSELPLIDIAEGFDKSGSFKLSELASGVELIQFETGPESYFVNVNSFSVGDKYIMIADNQEKRIILFTREGRFVRQIGRKGKGPGEYNRPSRVAMDPNDQFVFIHDGVRQRLIMYSTNGEFLKEISTEEVCYEEWFVDGVRFINDEEFVLIARRPRTAQDDFGSLLLYDMDLNFIRKILPRSKDQHLPKIKNYMNVGSERMYFWEDQLDTLYTIRPNGDAIPTHVIGSSSSSEDTQIFALDEFGKYFFVTGIHKEDRFDLVYDQKSGEIFNMDNRVECDTSGIWGSTSIENDLYGIEPVFMDRFLPKIDRYIVWVMPSELEYYYDLKCLKEKQVRFPKIRDEILRIAQDPEASENRIMVLLTEK